MEWGCDDNFLEVSSSSHSTPFSGEYVSQSAKMCNGRNTVFVGKTTESFEEAQISVISEIGMS
jgi:hypothetical protein